MNKIHYRPARLNRNACGRNATRSTETVHQVTCLSCQSNGEFIEDKEAAAIERDRKFMAQEPGPARGQFDTTNIVCGCGSDRFRYRGRSCYGHYDDFVCADCGHTVSRITETGMSF